ncbi:MAG TPA: hypothetical protein VJH03_04125 [Blastocatellia bacterium]|nr:hypothetical protein [Blastocatellia bacterium]
MRTLPNAIESRSRSSLPRLALGLLTAALLASVAAAPVRAQGFGVFKTKVSIGRKHPPAAYIGSGTVSVEVTSTTPIAPERLRWLRAQIESGLRSGDAPFTVVNSKPDTVVTCTITALGSSSRSETRTRTEWQKIGEHTVWREDTQTNETVEDYGNVDVTVNVTVFDSFMSAKYEAGEAATGDVLDSADLNPRFQEECEDRGGSYLNCSGGGDLIGSAASSIIRRLTPAYETAYLLLPKGKLKKASDLFAIGSWDGALHNLRAMPLLTR